MIEIFFFGRLLKCQHYIQHFLTVSIDKKLQAVKILLRLILIEAKEFKVISRHKNAKIFFVDQHLLRNYFRADAEFLFLTLP